MHTTPRDPAAPSRLFHAARSPAVLVFAVLVFAGTAAAAPINVAPLGTATASSEAFGSVAADGNDGNRDGAFGNGSVFHTADPDLAAFYEVDLGNSYYVDRIQILPRSDVRQGSVENFRLTVAEDNGSGAPGSVVFSQDYLPGASTFTFGTTDPGTAPAGTRGRFVRLQRLDGTPPFLTFAELEVYGGAARAGSNVALGKAVTASAPGFGASIDDGVDGDISGDFYNPGFPVYHSVVAGVGQFYEIDLGERVDLDYLELFDRGDADTTTQFRVAVLDENSNEVYSTIVDSVGVMNYDHTLDLTDVGGRFIRVETTLPEFLAFSELRAIAVPEPSALAALAGCAGALLVRRRRR